MKKKNQTHSIYTTIISTLIEHKMEHSCYMKDDFSSLNNSTFVIDGNKHSSGTEAKLKFHTTNLLKTHKKKPELLEC